VLAIPFADTAFAIGRRAWRRQGITVADKEHLHHLLIAFGHSHRRAVLVLWYWSALLAFAAVAVSLTDTPQLIAGGGAAIVVGIGLTALGVRRSRPADTDDTSDRVARRRIG
jgi:UDP-GlcNAc:undecaprenyl-phosphate/decaprenyl-phosphate GlcNAc-1-phosphate transferase